MTKISQTPAGAYRKIRNTSPTLPKVDPALVAKALGAEPTTESLAGALGPITLFAVREELVRRLQSSGGRPALAGTTRRAKVPLSDEEWIKLEELAAAVASPGFAPSAGQVASVLLTLSLQSVASRVASEPATSSLVGELQDLAKRCS
jgi:hypothetical protein